MTTVTSQPFFTCEDGEAILYTMKNGNGMTVTCTNVGADLVSILVPDREGNLKDVIMGYDDYTGYKTKSLARASTIGRFGNRIGKGRFTLNGKEYQVALNDHGKNHLHGGNEGFAKKLWMGTVIPTEYGQGVMFHRLSPDGEENYPGTLTVQVKFILTEENAIELHYYARSDADTIVNLTNHAYFNLAGHNAGPVLDHEVKLYADLFTQADEESIPTGRLLPVEGTPMDFLDFHRVGERIDDTSFEPIRFGGGYDHNWVLRKPKGTFGLCAEVYEPVSGRHMTCYTTCPCVQFYTANFLNGADAGKEGCRYEKRGALCLETQFAPDSVNHPDWDSPILRADTPFESKTVYQFDVK